MTRNFAVWKTVHGELKKYDPKTKEPWGQQPFKHSVPYCFIIGVPEETSAEAVLKKVPLDKGEEVNSGFDGWPLEITAAFFTTDVKVQWADLK